MKRFEVLFATLLLVTGLTMLSCERSPPPPGHSGQEGRIKYIQDCNTNICFAFRSGYESLALAEVPCDRVQHVLRNHCPPPEVEPAADAGS